jgi:N-acetylglutamate synthase-like GNAT family acetyltransferase
MGTPEGIELRYIAGDDPLIAPVEDLCYRTLHEPFGVSRQDDWNEMDPASRHLVALDGANVVGYGRLIDEDRWGHIRQVVVEPGYRRRGIATALVSELVATAGRTGMRRLYLNSRLPAVGMYEHAGFRVVSKEPFPMPRTYVPHVRMERVLR